MNKTVLKKRADLIKTMTKTIGKYQKKLSTAKIFDGKYYACDGHRCVCFTDIDGEVPFEVVENENEGGLYTQKKYFDNFDNNRRYGTIELKVPDLKQLKAFKKAEKAIAKANGFKDKVCFDFGYHYPIVQIDYIINILETIPDARFYILETDKERKYGYKFIPIYAEDTAGNKAMFLPVKPTSGYTTKSEWRFKYDWFAACEKIVGKDNCEKDVQWWYRENEYGYTADNINVPM